MKVIFVFAVVLWLVLGSVAQNSQMAASPSNLELLLDVHTTPVFDQKAKVVRYHASFELTIRNKGCHDYPLPPKVDQLWSLTISRQDSQQSLQWKWDENELKVKTLVSGQEVHEVAEWDSANDSELGVYRVSATFTPTLAITTKEFVLAPQSVSFLFTGRLMGYYRLPNKQPFQFARDGPKCVAEDTEHPDDERTRPSTDAKIFLTQLKEEPDYQVRVGMGDNFAPNYYSRAFSDLANEAGKDMYYWDTVTSTWQADPKDLNNLKDVRSGHGTIPTDNVACFLSRAHYDAIVPGTLDFHYGPERLRELARFLASIDKNDKFQPVQMLAANMMIKTSWWKDHDPVPDSAKRRLPFVTSYLQRSTPQGGHHACSPSADFNLEVTNITDGDFVFPWMQSVNIEAKGCSTASDLPEVYLCKTEKDPDDFINSCKQSAPLRLKEDTTEGRPSARKLRKLTYDLMPERFDTASVLEPGKNYAICIFSPKGMTQHDPSTPYCVRFSVYTPFLQYPDWPKEAHKDEKNPDYKNPYPYLVKNDSEKDEKLGRTPVVIFGIVDPQMVENIGADNDSWQTVSVPQSDPVSRSDTWNKQYKTQIVITDPVETLKELEAFFERDYPHRTGKKKPFYGIRVLMAQMPPYKAKQLAEHLPKDLRFDVIISAADNGLATPNQNLRIEPAVLTASESKLGLMNGALVTPATFIAVPPSHDEAENRWLQVRKLSVNSNGHTYWDYELTGRPIPVPVPSVESLECVANRFWDMVYDQLCKTHDHGGCAVPRSSPPDCKRDDESDEAAIQQLALWSIRSQVHADIALLQEKDFYTYGIKDYLAENCRLKAGNSRGSSLECDPQYEPKLDIQQILERIIWKGDFIKTRSVTGSVLKTILKESDRFAKTEKSGYLPTEELGRPLVTLGIRSDPDNSDGYLVNGRQLEPNALYTVATSDYVALGDTGYPELATPPVGDPDPPAMPRGDVYRISALTCGIIQLSSANSAYFVKNCDDKIPAKELFDRAANRKPDDPRAGNTNLRRLYAWTFLHPRWGQRNDHSRSLPAATQGEALKAAMQKRVENDLNWNWLVDQLSVGFSGLTHTDTTGTLSQKFGGVLNSQVNANHFHSWDWDAHSKFTFYQPTADWFAEGILQYSSIFTAQLGAPRNENQSRNLAAVDAGSYIHLLPGRGKGLPQLSLVLSGHFETNVGDVITNLSLNPVPPSTTGTTLTFDQGRTAGLLGRSGLRWQNRKSYIEAGLEGGSTLNAIIKFNILVAPGGATVPCVLEASVSLTNCINAFNQNNSATPVTGSSTVAVQRRPQDRYGAYWHIGMSVPINPAISYNFEDASEYFFLSSGDNSADTRFRHNLVSKMKFMVLPNLSFEPTYTIFIYENKLDYNFLLQQQYSVKINYSFDLSNLHEKKRQFMYAAPTSQ